MKSLTAFLGILLCTVNTVHAQPVVSARSALLFDANTGKVIFKKNENEKRAVASTQKLLTALIIAETGALDRMVTIEATDTKAEPTKLELKPGDSYTRQELLTALLIKSPNDVACALARDNAGSVDGFVAKMNVRMARLGGNASNFETPNGLPAPNQYSSARDMARVARAVYANPALRPIMDTKYYDFHYANGKTISLKNTNRVLRAYSFCNGMKTGYTQKAGHCLIASGSWNGRDMIAVVLGSTKAKVWDEAATLLVYGLEIPKSELASLRIAQPSAAN